MIQETKEIHGTDMLENAQGIREIVMYPTALCYCPLGKDWYHNQFKVTMRPDRFFPDYCDVQAWIEDNIDGHPHIIEDAVDQLYDYLSETYEPMSLEVKSHVDDAGHFPVTVTK